MNETHTQSLRQRGPGSSFDLKKRLEELARGECSADEFVRDSLAGRGRSTDSWALLSFIDQRYRLGQLPDELFQSIKSRIAWTALQTKEFGTTVELTPAPRESTPASAPASAPAATTDEPLAIEDIHAVIGHAEAPSAPPSLQPGRVLSGRFVLEDIIGSGGMGTVFKALDRRSALPAQADRHVALKILRDRVGQQQPAVLVQLRREFYCTQALAHPNIVKVYEMDRDADLAYYTMELLSGQPLCTVIARAQPAGLPRAYAWAVIRAVGSAIAHAHARNVIHGDLKPQNVMITDGGELRVLDFGSSRTSHATAAEAAGPGERLTASPPYASCDVLEGEQPDARDDLYSLACLFHELLSGSHPFQGNISLQARAAGLCAARPAGLEDDQWRALQAGLSWSRAERSIPVSEWLEQLGIDIEPQRLPNANVPAVPARVVQRRLPWRDFALPAMAACAALLIAVSSRHSDAPMPPARMPAPPVVRAPSISTPPPAASAPAAPKTAAAAPTRAKTAATAVAPPEFARDSMRQSARESVRGPALQPAAAAPPSTITLAAESIRVRRGVNFAEVRVLRTGDAADFLWWTENGSALAGKDYVPQPRIARSFSRDLRTATLFIRLSGNSERRSTRTFYVRIAPATARVHADLSRAAIVIPASR